MAVPSHVAAAAAAGPCRGWQVRVSALTMGSAHRSCGCSHFTISLWTRCRLCLTKRFTPRLCGKRAFRGRPSLPEPLPGGPEARGREAVPGQASLSLRGRSPAAKAPCESQPEPTQSCHHHGNPGCQVEDSSITIAMSSSSRLGRKISMNLA